MGVTMIAVVLKHGGGGESDGIVALLLVGTLLLVALLHLYGPLEERPRFLVALRAWLVWLVYDFVFSVISDGIFGTWAAIFVSVTGALLAILGRLMPGDGGGGGGAIGCQGLPQASNRFLLLLSMLLLLAPNAHGNVFFGDTTIAAIKVGLYFFMFFIIDYAYPAVREGDPIAVVLATAWLLFATPWFWFFGIAEAVLIFCHKGGVGGGEALLPQHYSPRTLALSQQPTYHPPQQLPPASPPPHQHHHHQQQPPYQYSGGAPAQGGFQFPTQVPPYHQGQHQQQPPQRRHPRGGRLAPGALAFPPAAANPDDQFYGLMQHLQYGEEGGDGGVVDGDDDLMGSVSGVRQPDMLRPRGSGSPWAPVGVTQIPGRDAN
jgi:hypothetical protein